MKRYAFDAVKSRMPDKRVEQQKPAPPKNDRSAKVNSSEDPYCLKIE